MAEALLVNAYLDGTKYVHDTKGTFTKKFNYGLLSISTHLERSGFRSRIIDADSSNTLDAAISSTLDSVQRYKPHVVGISCISGFGYNFTTSVAAAIKRHSPRTFLVVGGKDFIGLQPERIIQDCPAIDACVRGEGELALEHVMRSISNAGVCTPIEGVYINPSRRAAGEPPPVHVPALNTIPGLDYLLYPNIESHPPGVETARGCPYSCSFCSTNKYKLIKRSLSEIMADVEMLSRIHGGRELHIYFEAPFFNMTTDELSHLTKLRRHSPATFTWRAQTRVEYLTTKVIAGIAKAGGRVLDVGLESGSARMLSAMKKTRDPVQYLARAAQLLKDARSYGLKIKINLMFFPGDTVESLRETISFLLMHKSFINAVSAYPFIYYNGQDKDGTILSDLYDAGGSLVRRPPWISRRMYPVNTSAKCRLEMLDSLAVCISKAFQRTRGYFQEKQFGYISPHATYNDFVTAVSDMDRHILPFSANHCEMNAAINALYVFKITGILPAYLSPDPSRNAREYQGSNHIASNTNSHVV